MAGEAGQSDPYGPAKAQLREAIKWMVAAYGGLVAWTVGGVAVSNLGALPLDGARFWWGLAALLVALVLILVALYVAVTLLQPDLLYRADLHSKATRTRASGALADVRKHLNDNARWLLPWEFRDKTFDALLDDTDELERRISDPKTPPADADRARTELARRGGYFANLQSLASYLWLYHRFRRALPGLAACSVGALLGLAAFSVAVKSGEKSGDKAGAATTMIVNEGCGRCEEKDAVSAPAFAPVRFELGRAEVRETELAAVAAVRDWLRQHTDALVLLRAHTDTVAGEAVNASLARRRADAVRDLLTGAGGIERERVFVSELPRHALPEVTGSNAARPDNRVVEFVVIEAPRRR